MLVLTRKLDEEIIIGPSPEPVIVRVVDVMGDKVRIGVTALRSVEIHRGEIWDRITHELHRMNDDGCPHGDTA